MSQIETRAYGDHPAQRVQVWSAASPSRPPVVLLHGGWWRDRFTASLMDDLAADLCARGHQVWNLEYRRLGSGGGWPETFTDVLAAFDLAARSGVDLSRTVAIGHSAGGQLALLAAASRRVAGVVAQAPITDLPACAQAGLGEGATPLFIGGAPDVAPEAYRAASPVTVPVIGTPVLVVHGRDDDRVPIEQSRAYATGLAGRGGTVELTEVPDGDHFFVLRPDHWSWSQVCGWIDETQKD